MEKYRVEVTLTASCTYEVEIETVGDPEDEALKMWREKTPEDFQVDKGYITGWETDIEQLTWECSDCSAPITEEESRANGGRCGNCHAEYDREDAHAD